MGLAQWMPALLICAALGFWAWRLRLQAPSGGAVNLETVGSAPLGPSQRLVAVQAANRVYLLAVSAQGVIPVGELGAEEWLAGPVDLTPPHPQAAGQGAGS